ncbi:MAG: 23S rRNA (adenine(2503)-C(2))-methyltransferase RlmN [Chloroflexota bacterium]|nr:23S rRNA (adenine(2503)-C(2))-methyltransferase RlmN [Chloroflexota bacterium]
MTSSVYDSSLSELEIRFDALGQPKYRARQVWEWAFKHFAASYDEMTNLPASLRVRLAQELPFPTVAVQAELTSDDQLTRKRLLRLHDGKLIESVLMLYDPRSDSRGRATVCVSSQAGCAMGCVFCATGQAGFDRNLTAGEILAQITGFAREQADAGAQPLTNVVFMGMGEPMANYGEVWRAVETLNAPEGIGMAARHITISTVGLISGIRKLGDEPLQVGLAVSLHAPDEELRERLIPTARRFPLSQIIEACREYAAKTGRRVTFEYCLMDGINDSPEQARALADLLAGILCHVNLIPVNPTSNGGIQRPARSRSIAFQRRLAARGIACTVRVEKGVEISAACGQLRGDAAAVELLDAPVSKDDAFVTPFSAFVPRRYVSLDDYCRE